MNEQKRNSLKKRGFKVGSATDFLELTPEEESYIEIRLEISGLLKQQRKIKGWTQE